MMGLLSKDAILAANDLVTEDVAVPEWGGEVRVRVMTGAERAEFEAGSITVKGGKREANLQNYQARLVALCAIDEHGHRLFSEAEVEVLGGKSSQALGRVFMVAQRINGLGLGALEAAAKN